MARFRGVMKGSRGQTSRLGGQSSGLWANLASWSGGVSVTLSVKNDVDWAFVQLVPHFTAGVYRTIYDGPVNGKDAI
jgi:hypothetical protein